MKHTFSSTFQGKSSDQQYKQDNVWKNGSEVDNLHENKETSSEWNLSYLFCM